MLTKIPLENIEKPNIIKLIDGEDVSQFGAFPLDRTITLKVDVPRRLGACAVVLRIARDGERDIDLPLSFTDTDYVSDTYSLDIKLSSLGEECGLYYYELLFLRGMDTLFTDSINNLDFELSTSSSNRFRLSVFDPEFKVPEWFSGRIMYHIFVDRFACYGSPISIRDDAVINYDWDNGIPQYPKNPGDRYSNNVFFGGSLWGVIDKLDYLVSLGVGIIYLSPIFKAYSNHKYDTGDYTQIDEMFGGEKAFTQLIDECNARGIKIILDGVFNHTGDDSKYFDKYGKYGNVGAYTDPDSEYRNWFSFRKYPQEYESWWGIDILPKLNHTVPECREYFVGKEGIVAKYGRMGIGGWRLDVADELSNEFLEELRTNLHLVNDQAIIIGEVWENASDKISYGKRRKYFGGHQLDSVMNYPFRSALLEYLRYSDAKILADTLTDIYSSYPKQVSDVLMNILGTHDTERIITTISSLLFDELSAENYTNVELSTLKMSELQLKKSKELLKLSVILQYTVFGVPSVFYGDETALCGYHDPFCRMPYPWNAQDTEMIEFYKTVGDIRRANKVFKDGIFRILSANDGVFVFERSSADERIIVISNRSEHQATYFLEGNYFDLINNRKYKNTVPANSALILLEE